MRPLSKGKHSRNQWKHTAKERGDQERSLRTQLARVKAERAQAKQALKAAQARLRQIASQAQAVGGLPTVEVVWISLPLFLEAPSSFRAVSRVLTLLTHALGIQQAPCPQTVINWV
jgi:outer membrane protein TolC